MVAASESSVTDSPGAWSANPDSRAVTAFVDLPPEVLEQIYKALNITDRLSLRRTSPALRDIYDSSAALQYDFALQTSAYLDVRNQPPPRPPLQLTASSSSRQPPLSSARNPAPFQGRPTISSVTLAPYPDTRDEAGPPRASTSSLALAPSDKNRLLREREERWETLDAKHTRTFKVKGPAGVYELQEGILLMCDDFSDDNDGRRMTIRLIPLPSAEDPELDDPPVPTKMQKLDFSIADLTMDPTQDLVVVSEHQPAAIDAARQAPTHRFHLLSLSFKPHPLASMPVLDFPPFMQPNRRTRQLLQVMGEVLVILVSRYTEQWILAGLGMGVAGLAGLGNEEEVVCWNWKSGRVLARMSLPENGWYSSLALLTPTTFMITSTSNISPVLPLEPRSMGSVFPPVIQIYSFAPDPYQTIIPMQPLDADFNDDTTPRPVMVAQFEMPRFAQGVVVATFDIRPDPAFPPRSNDQGPQIGPGKPFTQDPSKGVLVFELSVLEPAESGTPDDPFSSKSYEMFVLRETLVQSGCEGEQRFKARREANDGYGYRGVEQTVPWAEWGEQKARILDVSMRQRDWVCSCSGYRFISLVQSEIQPPPNLVDEQHELIRLPPRRCDLRLFDFSPSSIRREISRHGLPSEEQEDVVMIQSNAGSEHPSLLSRLLSSALANRPSAAQEDHEDEMINASEKKVEVFVRLAPTVLPKRRIWKDDVVSSLPYREIKRYEAVRANGVMMDDQRVIVVCTRGSRNDDWSKIRQEMTVYCM